MCKSIISIHGVPRSGTTWLGQILNSSLDTRYKYQPLFSYAFKDAINVRSSKEQIEKFYADLYDAKDDFLDQVLQMEKGLCPKFRKNESPNTLVTKMVRYHYMIPKLLDELDTIKVVVIIRNPLEVLYSWKAAPKEFLPGLDFDFEWRYAPNRNLFKPEEYFGFEKWKEFIILSLWAKEKYPENVMVIKYKDLISDTENLTRSLFDFCGLDVDDQTVEFLNTSRSRTDDDPYSVYRKEIDLTKWKGNLPADVVDTIYRETSGTVFEQFL